MRREEYLHTLTEQIRCKMARGTIEQEINDHIEDQKEEFLSEGMSQTEAEEAAVREMGDPVEVGLEMDRIHKENIAIEIFERGAGYTRASGTGACAAAGVAYKLGLTNSKVIVHMPGGELQVEVEDDWNVYMTGDVFYVAKMTLSNEFAERLRAL